MTWSVGVARESHVSAVDQIRTTSLGTPPGASIGALPERASAVESDWLNSLRDGPLSASGGHDGVGDESR
ncbi:MAG: hypothetical protein JWM76_1832 [Pseudonocardiales bacterium]|nr:hypothetical protein [Pseudonocardiales bacterium]